MSELVRVTRGVWRPRLVADDLAGRVASRLSAYPDDTVVCGRTAARLHGQWLPSAGEVTTSSTLIVHSYPVAAVGELPVPGPGAAASPCVRRDHRP